MSSWLHERSDEPQHQPTTQPWHRQRTPSSLTPDELRRQADLDFQPRPGDGSMRRVGLLIVLASMVASALGLTALVRFLLRHL